MQTLKKVFASAGLVAVLSSLVVTSAVTAGTFADLSDSHWASPFVEQLVADGVVSSENANYRPADNLSRAEALKLAIEACGVEGTTTINFPDVKEADWFHQYVATGVANSVVGGYENGNFGPNDPVQRAQYAKMVVEACDLADKSDMDNPFDDVSTGAWYFEYVMTAYWWSIIDGYDNGNFGPMNNANRAEAAKMTANAMDPVERQEEPDADGNTGDLVISKSSEPGVVVGIPLGATGVHVASFNVKAGSEDATLDGLTLKRRDSGDPDDFDNVYIYHEGLAITNGKSLNTSENEVSFANMNLDIAAGKTERIDVIVDLNDLAGGAAGSGIHRFEVLSADHVDASGEVGGSFPVSSEQFSTGSVEVGQVDVERSGPATFSRTTGEVDVEVGGFNVNVDSEEDGVFTEISLYNDDDDVLSNLTLWRGSEQVASAVQNGRRFTFMLDEPIMIEQGDSISFKVRGDISGRQDDTATLYVRYRADVKVIGETYGYGLNVSDEDSDDTSYVDELDVLTQQTSETTVEAGKFTVVFTGPVSSDISSDGSDISLMNFNVTPDGNVDIEDAEFDFAFTSSVGTINASDFSNVEIVCDGSVVAQESTLGGTVTFDDDWSLEGGETYSCMLRVDVDVNVAGEEGTVTATLVDPSTWTIRDADSNDRITDVVPSSDIEGNEMTVTAAALEISVASTVASGQTYVKGATNVNLVAYLFEAGESDDVTINSLVLEGYLHDTDLVPTSTTGAKDIITQVSVYDSTDLTTPLDSAASFNSTTGQAQFDSLNWTIEAGKSKILIVKGNISTSAPQNGDTDRIAVGLVDVDADRDGKSLTAEFSGSPIVAGGNEVNGNNAGPVTVSQHVLGTGELVVTTSNSLTPDPALLASGGTYKVHTFRFESDEEAFSVEDLRVNSPSGVAQSNFQSVSLTFKNQEGVTVTETESVNASLEASFTGLDIYVPKDGQAVVDLSVTLSTEEGGAIDDTLFSFEVDTTTGFKALGLASSRYLTTPTGGHVTVAGEDMIIFETYPTVTIATTPSGNLVPSASTTVASISVAAGSNENVTFVGGDGNSFTVEVAGSCTGPIASTFTLKRGSTTLDTVAVADICADPSVMFDFSDEDLEIPAGTTIVLTVTADTSGLSVDGDSIQIWLDDSSTTNIDWSINNDGSNYNYAEIIFEGDLFGGALVKP